MSLARAWRRQLYGASSAALIVPSAMLAALLVLALGGGFSQVGVLGQIFAGPPAPSAAGEGAGTVAHALPVIPAAPVRAGSARPGTPNTGTSSMRRRAGVVPVWSRGPSHTGGAIGGAVPIVGAASKTPAPVASSQPTSAGSPSSPPSGPSPRPKPTPVDRIVGAVTPVTEQVPAPGGPAVTQAVQAVGSAADDAQGLKLP